MQIDNIEIEGIILVVYYEYEAEEREITYYPDGSGHPGSPAYVEIESIYVEDGDQDISQIICGKYKEQIREKLIEMNEKW